MTREKYFKDLKKKIDELYLAFDLEDDIKSAELENIRLELLSTEIKDEYYEDLIIYLDSKINFISGKDD